MSKELDPIIDFHAWDIAHNVGDSRGERIVTTFVSNITKLERHFLSEEGNGTMVYVVWIDSLSHYYITSETYDFIRERMRDGTPIKIEEVVCVERV